MTLNEYIKSLKGKKVTVIGMGVSNTPLIDLLLENGIDLTVRDRSEREKAQEKVERFESMGAKMRLGQDYLEDIDADVIFRTPGLRPDMPGIVKAVENGAVLTSEMEVFFDVCPCKIIAVTGSDGKTTTTTIVSELLKKAGYNVHVGGNIGTPLLTKADSMKKDDMVVLELSSFQLMTMKKSPDIAVITNLAPNHLDVHKDMDEYVDAKKNIFLHQGENGVLVLNLDNDITNKFTGNGMTYFFSRKKKVESGFYCEGGVIYSSFDGKTEKIMEAGDIFLPGVHNIENYLAAFSAVYGMVSASDMKYVAEHFTGVEHRIELVRELRGVKYYNDSIASSPSRTIAGLRSFDKKVILIAGGKDKGVAFDELGDEICRHVKRLVLTGFTAEKIKNATINSKEYTPDLPVDVIDGFKDAVIFASEHAEPGDIVILSPASTSFDRFKNFMERGNIFKEIVNGLE